MMILLAEVLTVVALSAFIYEAVAVMRKSPANKAGALESAAMSLSIPMSWLLYASFSLSLVSIQLTSWTFYATGRYLPYYNALIALYYAVVLGVCARAYRFVSYDRRIIFLMLYLLTVPAALSGYGVREVLIGVKYTAIPFLLYFFLRISLDTMNRVHLFLKLITCAGAVTAAYVIFELTNRFTGLWPGFWQSSLGFIEENRPAYINYINDFVYLKSVLVRPLGIFLDIYSHGFLMIAALFITLVMGESVFGKRALFLLQPVLILGILFSTVKSYIVLLVFWLPALFVLNLRWKPFDRPMHGRLVFSMSFLSAVLLISLVFYYRVLLHMFGRMLSITAAGSATHEIILDELALFFTRKLPYLLTHRPLNALFGFGYGTELSLAGESHFLGKQAALIGMAGFALYWSVFIRSARESVRGARGGCGDAEKKLFLFGAVMCVSLISTLLHYSPLNVCNNFIAAFLIYIGELAYGFNRGLYSSPGSRPYG